MNRIITKENRTKLIARISHNRLHVITHTHTTFDIAPRCFIQFLHTIYIKYHSLRCEIRFFCTLDNLHLCVATIWVILSLQWTADITLKYKPIKAVQLNRSSGYSLHANIKRCNGQYVWSPVWHRKLYIFVFVHQHHQIVFFN